MNVLKVIPTVGDPDEVVRGQLAFGNLNGDANPDFIVHASKRLIQAYSWEGRLLWQDRNPNGSIGDRFGMDTANVKHDMTAVWDLNGDGIDDVIHCWMDPQSANEPYLYVRDGRTGNVIAKHLIELGAKDTECHAAVFFMHDRTDPLILVPTRHPTLTERNFSDYLVRNIAFRFRNNTLSIAWTINTPDAGHWYYSLDENGDGISEGIFIGKYLVNENGQIIWTLPGWPSNDHVDAMQIADIDPDSPGLEIFAVGLTGGGLYSWTNRTRLWSIPAEAGNGQHIAVGNFDDSKPGLEIFVREKEDEGDGNDIFLINCKGQVYSRRKLGSSISIPFMSNLDLDGNRREDEVYGFNSIMNGRATKILANRAWYEGAQTLPPAEAALPIAERWKPMGFVFDLVNDPREELALLGRRAIVIGGNSSSLGDLTLRSYRSDFAYQLRAKGHYNLNRSVNYFKFE